MTMSGTKLIQADVCVVGAGIVGLAHAHEARSRGLSVVVVDRDSHAVGASVRNFGHLFFSSQADGEPFDAALRSRERWLELGRRAGVIVSEAGTVVVARQQDELALMEQVAANPARGARMLTASEVGALAPIPVDGLIGGFHGTLDLRADPRTAVAGLARLLDEDTGAQVCWNTLVHDVEPGVVSARGLQVQAPMIIICPGPDYKSLPPALQAGLEPLTLCQLQMLRIASPGGRAFPTALATGLSLVRYPSFRDLPAAEVLRARLQIEKGELLENGIHLLVTQLPDSDLVIGDTHVYGDTLPPFGQERFYELLLAEARELLGAEPEVRQRWHGVYPTVVDGTTPFHSSAPMPGVRVVQNVGGIGMTLTFGQAPLVFEELMAASVAV
jgi:FAD dependent oxidoreductase TIGR03364